MEGFKTFAVIFLSYKPCYSKYSYNHLGGRDRLLAAAITMIAIAISSNGSHEISWKTKTWKLMGDSRGKAPSPASASKLKCERTAAMVAA